MSEPIAWTMEYLRGYPSISRTDSPYTYEIRFGNGDTRIVIGEGIEFAFDTPMPSRWRRFWYRVLLGWTWKVA